jgi:hypothetical protein
MVGDKNGALGVITLTTKHAAPLVWPPTKKYAIVTFLLVPPHWSLLKGFAA